TAAGTRGLAVRADVGDPGEVSAMVTEVVAGLGPIDALVHAAGPFRRAPLLEESPEAWRKTFDANLHSLLYLAQAVGPGMRARRWGRIVAFGLASAEARPAPPNVAAYHVAKAALVALARSLAGLLAPDGITVNVISPGFLDSGGTPDGELRTVRS